MVFIDLTKAYDSIQRQLLWFKMSELGIDGKMMRTLNSLYENVKSCFKINNMRTRFFEVNVGLKQGCLLSPLLFNFYIDDLTDKLNFVSSGILINEERVNILMYADDILVLAENENDLQALLDIITVWCKDNRLPLNAEKSKVVYFRNPSMPKTKNKFYYENKELCLSDSYMYHGLLFTEFLDFNIMAKTVVQSASRALGLLIAKSKQAGGFTYSTLTKSFDSLVWSVIDYGAAIWGTTE